MLSFFSPIKTIYLRVSTKPQPNAAKSPLPVDVRRSKTLLLKLPISIWGGRLRKVGLSTETLSRRAAVVNVLNGTDLTD